MLKKSITSGTNMEMIAPWRNALAKLKPMNCLCEWESTIPYYRQGRSVKHLSIHQLKAHAERNGFTKYLKEGSLIKAFIDVYNGLSDFMRDLSSELEKHGTKRNCRV